MYCLVFVLWCSASLCYNGSIDTQINSKFIGHIAYRNMYDMPHNTLSDQLTNFLTQLTVSLLAKQYPAFCGTKMFITLFTTARHVSLSWVKLIQPTPSSYFFKIQFGIIHPSVPSPCKWSLSFSFPHQSPVCTSPLHHMCPMPYTSHPL